MKNGAVVTHNDGSRTHHSNVVSCSLRSSRGGFCVVLGLSDGTKQIIPTGIEVMPVSDDFIAKRFTGVA